jgi:hypothetical protein
VKKKVAPLSARFQPRPSTVTMDDALDGSQADAVAGNSSSLWKRWKGLNNLEAKPCRIRRRCP